MSLPDTEGQQLADPGVAAFQLAQYAVRLHTALDDTAATWDRLGSRNMFLSSHYLRALHAAPPSTMRFHYFTVWKGERLCGIIYTQLDTFQAQQSISYHKDAGLPEPERGLFKQLRNLMARRVKVHTILCGNSLVTGDHGFLFEEAVSSEDQWSLVNETLHWLIRYLRKSGMRVNLLFVKDFSKPAVKKLHMVPDTRVYHGFHAQPNMILNLLEEWTTFDDYLSALSSKYRVRVRRAYKKADTIEKRELQVVDLENHHDKIIEYYRDIAENASFNLFILNPEYFISVKRHLGENFRIFGYFKGDKLIAFYSLMINGDEIEAHFLGYEEETNRKYQLYQNMLLDMIALAIPLHMQRIIYGRTAMEIKSTVGAEPYPMYFYLQYQNALINRCVPWIYHTLEPEVQWVQRRPFRGEIEDAPGSPDHDQTTSD